MTPIYKATRDYYNIPFEDISVLFDGVRILKMDGFLEKGKAVNIYTAQWVNSQEEDFMITTLDEYDNPIVIRENVNIEVTFIIREKYANDSIDILETHDDFIDFMTGGDIWLMSEYVNNKFVHCVCINEYKPTTVKLGRGSESYIMGTITLHTLDAPISQDDESPIVA